MKAKKSGPVRSPTVLLTPSPRSAKAEAHWLTACSHEPAQSMSSISTQNSRMPNRRRTGTPSTGSSASEGMGTVMKKTRLASGTSAQMTAMIRQCAMPKMAKKAVEISTTPI